MTLAAVLESSARSDARPSRLAVSIENAAFASDEAPITIVEFTDFQCPFCRRHAEEVLPTLWDDYVASGRVRYVIMDLPLPMHDQAPVAAAAARCAGEQEEYKSFHDALFARETLENDWAVEVATEVGLDLSRFGDCMDAPGTHAAVETAVDYASSLQLNSTPTFVIGRTRPDGLVEGQVLRGLSELSDFAAAIDDLDRSL